MREAGAGDLPVLTDALSWAMNWRGEQRFTLAAIMAAPELAHYVAGWPRAGDFGVVAEAGADALPVGAAWCRTFAAEDPGYGFVADDVAEVSMGVDPDCRGRGIGTALLDALIARARVLGLRAVSLSVEDGNRARALYERAGFRVVGRNGDSDTMLLPL